MMRLVRRIALWTLGVFAAVVIVLAILAAPIAYRVFHGLDRYEATPPSLPAILKQPAILVFSKTNGFRDDPAIDASNAMFREIGTARGWTMVFSENGAVFNPAQLALFKAVVWNNASGDVLTPDQRQAFRSYLENGGGFVGVHGAGGDPNYRWRWYVDELIGAQFIGHTMWPHRQRAFVHVEDPTGPIMAGLPRIWVREDEWYSFDRSVQAKGYHVLATVDERTYVPHGLLNENIRMGRDHPIIWSHCVGRGRAFFSALGHFPATYSAEPLHRQMLADAVAWAAGLTGDDCKAAD